MLVKLKKIVWSELYNILSSLIRKWSTIFDKGLAPFYKTFLWLKQLFDATINLKIIIFQCSKNYGSPTRVTRLKVTPNMADPISLNEKRP